MWRISSAVQLSPAANFFVFLQAWYEAYAMGAKIVFFPTDLSMPDRNANNYAKIFRYNIVGNGQPGGIYTDYGTPANDTRFLPHGDWLNDPVVTGTIDLDSQWFHEVHSIYHVQ
jgi:hypothetical protein|eukprot:COSAG02_NODE_45958_length_352_cov_1.830040_1_plen_114_part_10